MLDIHNAPVIPSVKTSVRHTHTHTHTHMYPFVQRGESTLMVVAKKDKSKEKQELLKLLVACKANVHLKDNVN